MDGGETPPAISAVAAEEAECRLYLYEAVESSKDALMDRRAVLRSEMYEDRIGALSDELKAKTLECTDTLERLEDFMVLLDEARDSEGQVRERLVACEEEVHRLRQTTAVLKRQESDRGASSGIPTPSDAALASAARAAEMEQELQALRQERDVQRRHAAEQASALDVAHEQMDELQAELEERAGEYTDALERLEELVKLLEVARAAEQAATASREEREAELADLQARSEDLSAENQRLWRLLGEQQSDVDRPRGLALTPDGRWDGRSPESVVQEGRRSGSSPTPQGTLVRQVGGTDGWPAMREQLEQLKREKEALLAELEMKDVNYTDALALLNAHIGQLMDELNIHLRGGERSASNARALLLEIAELRVEQGRTSSSMEGFSA